MTLLFRHATFHVKANNNAVAMLQGGSEGPVSLATFFMRQYELSKGQALRYYNSLRYLQHQKNTVRFINSLAKRRDKWFASPEASRVAAPGPAMITGAIDLLAAGVDKPSADTASVAATQFDTGPAGDQMQGVLPGKVHQNILCRFCHATDVQGIFVFPAT